MSSATSTETVPLKPEPSQPQALQPWQFFVLAALVCATILTFVVRGQGVTTVIVATLLMGGVALVGAAMLRAVRPLVGAAEDRTPVVGGRTRAALEREKLLVLRAIKELEFDRAMGKLSEDDFHEMAGRLRPRAARLIRQLDARGDYLRQIEQELAKRLGEDATPSAAGRQCARCATANDADARFCKSCGQPL